MRMLKTTGFIVCFATTAIANAENLFDWNKAARAYIVFSANAFVSDAQGNEVLGSLPILENCDDHDTGVADLMIDSDYFNNVAKKAQSGSIVATQIMYRLLNLVCGDAAHTELLDIAIGNLIKTQPSNFLAALSQYPQMNLRALLGNLGEDYVDKPNEAIKELQLRYAALASVKGASTELQKKCLDELSVLTLNKRNHMVNH